MERVTVKLESGSLAQPSPMCDPSFQYITPKLEIKQELLDPEPEVYEQVNHIAESNHVALANYYEATQLQVKDELQDHLDDILCHVANPASEDDPGKLRELLVITIRTLKGVKEQLDTVTELRNQERFALKRFQGSDEDIRFWTGFTNYATVMDFYEKMLGPDVWDLRQHYWNSAVSQEIELEGKCNQMCSLMPLDELFLTLVKLKQGSANKDLAERFQVCELCVNKIFVMWIYFLHAALDKADIWMTKQKVQKDMPPLFRSLYADVRVVVDFVEIVSDKPSDVEVQAATYSCYKRTNILKGLIGTSPSGLPTFISDLYDGSISESQILFDSGLLRRLNARDAIFSDKVFTSREELAKSKIRLIVPPFLTADTSATVQSAVDVGDRARVCLHVSRLMSRVKEYQMLENKVPMKYWHHVDRIFKVCAKLMIYWPRLEAGGKSDATEMSDI